MNKKLQIFLLKKMFPGEIADLIDFESEIDSTLRLQENISQIKKRFLLRR